MYIIETITLSSRGKNVTHISVDNAHTKRNDYLLQLNSKLSWYVIKVLITFREFCNSDVL